MPKAGDVQLVMRAPVPRPACRRRTGRSRPGGTVELRPSAEPERRTGVVVLTVGNAPLSIDFASCNR